MAERDLARIGGRAGKTFAAALAKMGLLAKMESQQALTDLEQATLTADGLIVAQGDLGYDLPPEGPGWQKRMVRAAETAGKPVIVAAQMLESMVNACMNSPRPLMSRGPCAMGPMRSCYPPKPRGGLSV